LVGLKHHNMQVPLLIGFDIQQIVGEAVTCRFVEQAPVKVKKTPACHRTC